MEQRVNEESFGFGFNDPDFSDRVLNIEITPGHQSNDSDCSAGIEVESLHITSLILAAKSPFFYKLFKNGMKESQSRNASLKISSHEKTALMDLLNFMYSNALSATTSCDLLDVLILADKFEVSYCMRYCIQLLLKTPMSLESAVSYLELPSAILEAEVVQPLIDAAKLNLTEHFKHFNNSLEEAMKLSLPALEFVLGSGSLRVDSEDDVFDFVLKWAHAHYPKLEECQEIINGRLVQFICFPYMSCLKLKKVLVCPEFDHEEVSKLVMEALFYKAGIFCGEHIHVPEDLGRSEHFYGGHIYHDRLVKAAQLDFSQPRRVIYFELKKEECESMSPTNSLYSQQFLLGGLWFSLLAQRRKKEQSSIEHFGLFLKTRKGSKTCTVQLVVEVMKSSSNKFEGRIADNNSIVKEDQDWGWANVLRTPWTTFMRDDSGYFINGILRFRVDITIINSQA